MNFDPTRLALLAQGRLADDEARALVDALARLVERDPRYRIAREMVPRDRFDEPSGAPVERGVIADVEATGLDRANDAIVEIGLVAFDFEPATGRVLRVVDVIDELEDPGRPIPPETTAVHGIDDAMVRGKRIDDARVAAMLAQASIVIAHNAEYDRAMLERRFDCFSDHRWACSAREVPWRSAGFASNALGHLALASGLFFGAHRAAMDCRALLEVLSRPLPLARPGAEAANAAAQAGGAPDATTSAAPPDDQPLIADLFAEPPSPPPAPVQPPADTHATALGWLMESAARGTRKLWAVGAPFDRKDLLKARGYRWHAGDDGNPKAWALTLPAEDARMTEELAWLRTSVFRPGAKLRMDSIDARCRYTDRISATGTVVL